MLIAACLLTALAVAWFGAKKLHRFAYWIDRKTDAEIRALATGRWRVQLLEVTAGVRLTGLVRPPAKSDGKWVLFVPGNSTALLAGFQAELQRTLPSDVGVAFWAYRGFESSGGSPTPEDLLSDLVQQWELLKTLNQSPEPPEVFGYSLGAILAVQLTAELTRTGDGPRRLVLASAGERIPIMKHGMFGRFQSDDVYDATVAAGEVQCPVVIVHGLADDALPIETARNLRELIGDNAKLHELPGKGHTDVWDGLKEFAW